MHSIRTKIIVLVLAGIVAVSAIITALSVFEIRKLTRSTSNQMLMLACESGQKNIDTYFKGVSQGANMMANYAESDLAGIELEDLESHILRVEDVFAKNMQNVGGVFSYYYRIDPAVSQTEKGFLYVNVDGTGFKPHAMTDISFYNLINRPLAWFTIPKQTGEPVWLPPYLTEDLERYIISYNIPIYKNGGFVGVIGIEVSYNEIARLVRNVKIYNDGYAFLSDENGRVICHPRIPVYNLIGENGEKTPYEIDDETNFAEYAYDGVKKMAVCLPLDNGMRLNVTVSLAEINATRDNLLKGIIIVSAILLLLSAFITMHMVSHVTRPLKKLTEAAKQVDGGSYDVDIETGGRDEVGVLSNTFKNLVDNLKVHIGELSDKAYSDAMTEVYNKGAFDRETEELQKSIDDPGITPEFTVCMFDCNDLKLMNDRYGHIMGDIYLKNSAALITSVFANSPVFRIGGDEFASILHGEDYQNRENLAELFRKRVKETNIPGNKPWERLGIAIGMADYIPGTDKTADDVISRADRLMYNDKRLQKEKQVK